MIRERREEREERGEESIRIGLRRRNEGRREREREIRGLEREGKSC